jgi:hypothetical protein
MRRTLVLIPLLALAAALLLGACGDDDDEATTANESTTAEAEGGGGALTSAISVDKTASTVTLPLFEGSTKSGEPVFYIVTDSSDEADAEERGVNFAPKLANALGTKAVQEASEQGDELVFEGTVDFSPENKVVPSKDGFPPEVAKAGAVGDANYSPLVTTDGETVINASQVANDSGMHDGIVEIDMEKMEVTMSLLEGFVDGTSNLYLRTEASAELVAAIESSTYVPNLNDAPRVGSNDPESARSAIVPIVNGLREADDPAQRQGLGSALLGEGAPRNIEQEPVGSELYSPIWDVTPAAWTDQATAQGERKLLTTTEEVAAEVKAGRLESPGMGPANESLGGLKALPAISNCSIVSTG